MVGIKRVSGAAAVVSSLLAILAAASAAMATLPAPVDRWDFNGTSGTAVNDSGANGINGTLMNGAAYGPGATVASGGAVYLDGTDDYAELTQPSGVPASLGQLHEGSFSVFFKFNRLTAASEIFPILYVGSGLGVDGNSSANIEVGHAPAGDSKIYFTMIRNVVNSKLQIPLCFDTGFNLEVGQWYHFVAVVGPNGNTGYLNGQELTDRHYNFGDATRTDFMDQIIDQQKIWIGRGFFARRPDQHYMDGAIDDVAIYDRALTATEVQDLYQSLPEPASVTLLLAGAWMLAARRRGR